MQVSTACPRSRAVTTGTGAVPGIIQKGKGVLRELNDPDSFRPAPPTPKPGPAHEVLKEVVPDRELVDTKCYFRNDDTSGDRLRSTGAVRRPMPQRRVPPDFCCGTTMGRRVVLHPVRNSQPLRFDAGWAARLVQAEGV